MKVCVELPCDAAACNVSPLPSDGCLKSILLTPTFRFGAKYAKLATLSVLSGDGKTTIENELLVHRATGKLVVRPPTTDTVEFDNQAPATGT